MTLGGMIWVCALSLIATPVLTWLHGRLGGAESPGRLARVIALGSYVGAWLSALTFVISLLLLITLGLTRST